MTRTIPIPVCFDADFGPDVEAVALHAGLSPEDVVERFVAGRYAAAFLGFAPGFAYLDGVPGVLRVERLPSPRPRVPPGSVAIAGARAGIYPCATPGGWRLLGRTPRVIFDAWREPSALILPGDTVIFRRIDRATFDAMEREERDEASARRARHGTSAACTTREPTLRVVHPGVRSSIQDLGRPGHEASGVPIGGAADALSLRVANRLVGNADGDAAIECAAGGLTVEFVHDATIAICGGDVAATVSSGSAATDNAGAMHELPMWRGVSVRAGERVRVGGVRAGCRVYVAVAGGVDVPRVLGSRSTLASAGFGGFEGRELRAGDGLCAGERRGVPVRALLAPATLASLRFAMLRRVLRITLDAALGDRLAGALLASTFRVRPASDRVGVRLDPGGPLLGADGLANDHPSRAAGQGTVQIPGASEVIALLADAPPTGGYAVAGAVIGPDLCALGQVRAGEVLRFERVSATEAEGLAAEREAWLGTAVPRVG